MPAHRLGPPVGLPFSVAAIPARTTTSDSVRRLHPTGPAPCDRLRPPRTTHFASGGPWRPVWGASSILYTTAARAACAPVGVVFRMSMPTPAVSPMAAVPFRPLTAVFLPCRAALSAPGALVWSAYRLGRHATAGAEATRRPARPLALAPSRSLRRGADPGGRTINLGPRPIPARSSPRSTAPSCTRPPQRLPRAFPRGPSVSPCREPRPRSPGHTSGGGLPEPAATSSSRGSGAPGSSLRPRSSAPPRGPCAPRQRPATVAGPLLGHRERGQPDAQQPALAPTGS